MKTLILALLLTVFSFSGFAEDKKKITDSDYKNNQVEMADTFREEGKIYVVIAVMLSIFAGTTFYLMRQDRKLNRLELEVEEFIRQKG